MKQSGFYKLAAIDLDGTLIGPNKLIGPDNLKAVDSLQKAGCMVVLASGRRHENMLSFAHTLGLDGFMISCQGAVVKHIVTDEQLYKAHLPREYALDLIALGIERDMTVLHWSPDGVYARAHTRWVDIYSTGSGDSKVKIVADLTALQGAQVEKIMWVGESSKIVEFFQEMSIQFRNQLHVVITDEWYLEFTAFNATKAKGVAAVAHHLGISQEDTMTFGDGNNDVSMIAWAGLGVAMNHGQKSAKDVANFVTPAGDRESAFARAVEIIMNNSFKNQN